MLAFHISEKSTIIASSGSEEVATMCSKNIFDSTDTTVKRVLMAPHATVIAVSQQGGRRHDRNSRRNILEARQLTATLTRNRSSSNLSGNSWRKNFCLEYLITLKLICETIRLGRLRARRNILVNSRRNILRPGQRLQFWSRVGTALGNRGLDRGMG